MGVGATDVRCGYSLRCRLQIDRLSCSRVNSGAATSRKLQAGWACGADEAG